MPVTSSSDTGTDIWNSLSGKSGYNIQNQQYDPTRPDQERALALQQRAQQQKLAQAIQARALGQGGPSVAELQGQRGLAQAQQQAMQMANSARGVDRAAAFRQAQNAQAGMATEANSQAAMLRANEQIQAQQLGGNVNQGIRGQDIESRGISTQEQLGQLNANVQMEQARAKQASEEAEREQKLTGGAVVAAGSLFASDMRAKEDIVPIKNTAEMEKYIANTPQAPEQNRHMDLNNWLSTNKPVDENTRYGQEQPVSQSEYNRAHAFDAMRNSFAISDERSKEKIRALSMALDRAQGPAIDRVNAPVEPGSHAALAPVQPYSYRYKPEFAAALGQDQGQRVGVMAQDLERSPAYAPAVVETPMGKAIDKDRLLQANTAQLGGIDKRLAELEAARGKAIDRVNEPVKKDKNRGLAQALEKAGPAAVKRVNEPVQSPKARGR